MNASRLMMTSAAALLLVTGAAFAQSMTTTTTTVEKTYTPQQDQTIYTTITKQQSAAVVVPPNWSPSVGVAVPESVTLQAVPTTIDVPAVRDERYVVIDGRVVLVDPSSRKVVRIINQP